MFYLQPVLQKVDKPALILAFFLFSLSIAGESRAERIFFAGYDGGFYIKSEQEGGMALHLGGAFQVDYQTFGEQERADDGFDIRRSRLAFRGTLTRYFKFGLEYEFQGNDTKHLVDAYGECVYGVHFLRFGQFKEPFSLEWQTNDKGIYFAERSMGYYLTPGRDMGAMLSGSFFDQSFFYSTGIFNGNGIDGSSEGSQGDDPEFATRLVYAPFKNRHLPFLTSFQIGTSMTYSKIELNNVDLKVKSTGMASSNRNIYVLLQNTKFGVLQDVDSRQRFGFETAWAEGPFALMGELMTLRYKDLVPSGQRKRDADFHSWYASVLLCLTGEDLVLSNGVMKPLYPKRFFNPEEGSYGALVLAARIEHFSGDKDWITPDTFVSIRAADGFSVAVNWILFPMQRFVLDYTYTDFSDPIRSRVNPNGSVDYIHQESVVTGRFSIDF